MEELSYIVVSASTSAVYNLLHGRISMRDIILNQKKYWNVDSGEEISMDIVKEFCLTKSNSTGLDCHQMRSLRWNFSPTLCGNRKRMNLKLQLW